MLNTLTVLLSIHVLAAALWVGGGFLLNIAMLLAARSGDPAMRLAAMRLASFAGPLVFLPLALVVLLSGAWLTEKYFDWGDLWVVLGLIGLVTASTVGLLYLTPRTRRAVAGMEQGAPPPSGRNWVPVVGELNLLLIVAVLVLMVIRPT
ncbi:MAG: DUF2269 family protein [Solirubrobacterales bacterium]